MPLLDRLRPKWKHRDPAARIEAVRRLSADDPEAVLRMAQEDPEPSVRRAAIKRIEDPEALSRLAEGDADETTRRLAAERASRILVKRATGDGTVSERAGALERLSAPEDLALVAREASIEAIALQALARVTEPGLLADVARHAVSAPVRLSALAAVTTPSVLSRIAVRDESEEVAMAALQRLADPHGLAEVARRSPRKALRRLAAEKLQSLGGAIASPDSTKHRRAAQTELVSRVEALSRSWNLEQSAPLIDEAREDWQDLGSDALEDLRRRFDAAVRAFEEHREEYRRQRAGVGGADRLAERRSLCEWLEGLNDEDLARGLREARARLRDLGPSSTSDERALDERFRQAYRTAEERLADLRGEREKLERERREAIEREEREKAEAEAAAEAEARRQTKAEAKARRKAKEQEESAKAEALAVRLEGLTAASDLGEVIAALREAQAHLKERRPRPHALSKRLEEAIQGLQARAQDLRETEQWKLWSSEMIREELCRKVEALVAETDLKKASRVLAELRKEWNEAGPAPRPRHEELSARFNKAAKDVRGRCDEHFARLDAERQENLDKKLALCEKAEALSGGSEWNATAQALQDLQKEWKAIGEVPRARGKELWNRFHEACDSFFQRRKEHFQQKDAERSENQSAKEALCQRAEELGQSMAFDDAVAEVKRLQEEWRKVGPVPKAKGDLLWARFRKASHAVFERRANRHAIEQSGHRAKLEEFASSVEALRGTEGVAPDALFETVSRLRSEWLRLPVKNGDADLRHRFEESLLAVLAAYPDAFRGSDLDIEANRRALEELLARAEALAPKDEPGGRQSLDDMVRKLRHALTTEGARSADVERRSLTRELERIQAAWQKVGLVRKEAYRVLESRFRRACEAAKARRAPPR